MKYRIDIRRSKRGMIVRSFWTNTLDENYPSYTTIYEQRGKRMYKIKQYPPLPDNCY